MGRIFHSLCQFPVSATGNRQKKAWPRIATSSLVGGGVDVAGIHLLVFQTNGITIIVSWEIHWGKMFGVSSVWTSIWVYVYIHIIPKLNMVNVGWINPFKKWHTHPGKQTWTQWTQHTPCLRGNSFSKPSIWNYCYCCHDYIVFMLSSLHYMLGVAPAQYAGGKWNAGVHSSIILNLLVIPWST